MKILYLNHTGQMSGAEHSLLDLIGGLPAEVQPLLACDPEGPLRAAAAAMGVRVLPLAATDGSLKLHPTGTPRATAELGHAAFQAARHARRQQVDLLHANSIRAGLIGVAAGRLARRPVVAHLRDRLPRSTIADASLRTIAAGATAVLANSDYTAAGMRAVAEPKTLVSVPNPIDLRRFDPESIDRDAVRSRLGLPRWALALGVVGQITPWKGQLEMVQALATLVERRPELRLLIVGEAKFVAAQTRYDNLTYLREIEHAIAAQGLGDRVQLLGERADVPELMRALDMLLVPSWEEPFGRVVVEGMALGVPVLATAVGGPAEILEGERGGLLLPPRDVAGWAQAIDRLCGDEGLRARLGRDGRARAKGFGVEQHVGAVVDVYRRICA
jgi:L-malate glycosyltransferase